MPWHGQCEHAITALRRASGSKHWQFMVEMQQTLKSADVRRARYPLSLVHANRYCVRYHHHVSTVVAVAMGHRASIIRRDAGPSRGDTPTGASQSSLRHTELDLRQEVAAVGSPRAFNREPNGNPDVGALDLWQLEGGAAAAVAASFGCAGTRS